MSFDPRTGSGLKFTKRHRLRCFFVGCLCASTLYQSILTTEAAASFKTPECLSGREFTTGGTFEVIDGDTLKRSDGVKIRIIGINTPELDAQSPSLRYWARQAKHSVQNLIRNASVVQLVEGIDRYDQYGRLLAHAILPDGTSIGEHLVQQGLAAAVAVGENNLCARYHAELESLARTRKTGIWSESVAWYHGGANSGRQLRGFHIVEGKITASRRQRGSIYLYLHNNVLIRIEPQNLSYFNRWTQSADSIQGKRVEIRGWFYQSRGNSIVDMSHPLNMRLLAD